MKASFVITVWLALLSASWANLKCFQCKGAEQCKGPVYNVTVCDDGVNECFTYIDKDDIRKDCRTPKIIEERCIEKNNPDLHCSFCRGQRCRICCTDLCNTGNSLEYFSRNCLVLLVLSLPLGYF